MEIINTEVTESTEFDPRSIFNHDHTEYTDLLGIKTLIVCVRLPIRVFL